MNQDVPFFIVYKKRIYLFCFKWVFQNNTLSCPTHWKASLFLRFICQTMVYVKVVKLLFSKKNLAQFQYNVLFRHKIIPFQFICFLFNYAQFHRSCFAISSYSILEQVSTLSCSKLVHEKSQSWYQHTLRDLVCVGSEKKYWTCTVMLGPLFF